VLDLRKVCKQFGTDPAVDALIDVDLVLRRGEWLSITGPSGSGKSTLLNILGCLDRPTRGKYLLDGIETTTLSENERAGLRSRRIGFIFQSFHLLPYRTVLENVMLAMMFSHAIPKRQQRQRAGELLSRLGLGARLAHKPQHLSRGEQQRVAIARALANNPSVVLADEPCASLDAHTAREVLAAFLAICREERKTLLIVSHDAAVLGAADQVLDLAEMNRADSRHDAA